MRCQAILEPGQKQNSVILILSLLKILLLLECFVLILTFSEHGMKMSFTLMPECFRANPRNVAPAARAPLFPPSSWPWDSFYLCAKQQAARWGHKTKIDGVAWPSPSAHSPFSGRQNRLSLFINETPFLNP